MLPNRQREALDTHMTKHMSCEGMGTVRYITLYKHLNTSFDNLLTATGDNKSRKKHWQCTHGKEMNLKVNMFQPDVEEWGKNNLKKVLTLISINKSINYWRPQYYLNHYHRWILYRQHYPPSHYAFPFSTQKQHRILVPYLRLIDSTKSSTASKYCGTQ